MTRLLLMRTEWCFSLFEACIVCWYELAPNFLHRRQQVDNAADVDDAAITLWLKRLVGAHCLRRITQHTISLDIASEATPAQALRQLSLARRSRVSNEGCVLIGA